MTNKMKKLYQFKIYMTSVIAYLEHSFAALYTLPVPWKVLDTIISKLSNRRNRSKIFSLE